MRWPWITHGRFGSSELAMRTKIEVGDGRLSERIDKMSEAILEVQKNHVEQIHGLREELAKTKRQLEGTESSLSLCIQKSIEFVALAEKMGWEYTEPGATGEWKPKKVPVNPEQQYRSA